MTMSYSDYSKQPPHVNYLSIQLFQIQLACVKKIFCRLDEILSKDYLESVDDLEMQFKQIELRKQPTIPSRIALSVLKIHELYIVYSGPNIESLFRNDELVKQKLIFLSINSIVKEAFKHSLELNLSSLRQKMLQFDTIYHSTFKLDSIGDVEESLLLSIIYSEVSRLFNDVIKLGLGPDSRPQDWKWTAKQLSLLKNWNDSSGNGIIQ